MLPSQRALFDMPRDVCYMNAAGWGPMPLATQEAGRAAMNRKGQPWKLAADHASPMLEWTARAPAGGFAIDTVKQPADGDWTSAVLDAIERKGAAPLAMVSISSV